MQINNILNLRMKKLKQKITMVDKKRKPLDTFYSDFLLLILPLFIGGIVALVIAREDGYWNVKSLIIITIVFLILQYLCAAFYFKVIKLYPNYFEISYPFRMKKTKIQNEKILSVDYGTSEAYTGPYGKNGALIFYEMEGKREKVPIKSIREKKIRKALLFFKNFGGIKVNVGEYHVNIKDELGLD